MKTAYKPPGSYANQNNSRVLPGYNATWRRSSLSVNPVSQQSTYLTEKALKERPLSPDVSTSPPVSWFKLLRFAKSQEKCLMIIGVIMACINGAFVPLSDVMYGEFTALLIDRTVMKGTSTSTFTISFFGGGKILKDASPEENKKALIDDSIAFGVGCITCCIIQFIVGAIGVDLFNYVALMQTNRVKEKFLYSVLRQDITWYDLNTSMNFATKISDDVEKYREGIGEKVNILIYLLSTFIYAVMISFYYGWALTLVVLSTTPITITATFIVAKMQSNITTQELNAYSIAGVMAEEVLSSIRTVVAFGGEQLEVQRYKHRLKPAEKMGIKKGVYAGIGSGVMWLIIYATYSLAFWYGVGLILDCRQQEVPAYTPAVLMIIFFSILQGAQNVGLTAPHIEAINTARASGGAIFALLDRKPVIDSLSEHGTKPVIHGDFELRDVHFRYPARPDVQILHGLNLQISKFETVALVGATGSGKSTVLHLIQRMYDPDAGSVLISGNDLRNMNVRHLRDHIAVVGQEPVLFAGTIKFNIRLSNPNCTDDEILMAAKQANCHEFINKLSQGYDTMISERGAQLSGGQKQRIAIARALVRKPTILILDEATSALDSSSEAKVQKALDAAAAGRTTIMVSHRLATVINATRIVVMDKGDVMEQGTHVELLAMKGRYYNLVLENEPGIARPVNPSEENVKKRRPEKPIQDKMTNKPSLESVRTVRVRLPDNKNAETKQEEYKPSSRELMKLCAPEKYWMVCGVLAAIVVGSSFPTFAILFGEIYGLLESEDAVWVRTEANKIVLLFLLVGFVMGSGIFLQIYIFNFTGVKLTARLRVGAFQHMLKQEIGWFDEPVNGVGSLCARLAADAAGVQGATGTRIGALMQAIATISLGFVLSMYLSWKMTLVALISVPMIIGAVVLEGRVLDAGLKVMREASNKATNIATEAITNIRTVLAFCGEHGVMDLYRKAEVQARVAARRSIRWRGCVYSFGQTAPVAGYAVTLWYGGVLVANKEVPYKTVIQVSEALIFGAWMMGQALAFAPNFGAAVAAAGRILTLMHRQSKIRSTDSPCVYENYITNGKIEYKNIKFSYPTRPEVEVVRNLSLLITSGQRVAFVGSSGCGKSTLIQILQRLYDPDDGTVHLDDYNITRDIRLTTLRRNLGIVSQEPVLFDRTIAANIAYGDNTRIIKIEEIVHAAIEANVHHFIAALPDGYNTRLGARASQLSGGQKQRIAIARALVRNPRILLLDEATSALDTTSEKVVQKALDKASEGRTCLIIAHRLATIQNADVICVIDHGVVEEMGTHEELIQLKGIYAKLYELQCGIEGEDDDGHDKADASTETN